MDSAPSSKGKLGKTFNRVFHFKTASKSLANTGFCLLVPNEHRVHRDTGSYFHGNGLQTDAFVAKLFAGVSAVKAAYAELQAAQFPYNHDAIQSADEALVRELKGISELKQMYLKKQIDSAPPHLTILLSEIQEQQSMMKMYELTMKKLQMESENKDGEIWSRRKELAEIVSSNRLLEKKMNSSGQFSVLDGVNLPNSNPNDFPIVLHHAVRSVRSFVKQMVRDMEFANWDIDAAVKSIVAGVHFQKPNHRCFAFESFVCREMLDGFNSISFSPVNEASNDGRQWREASIDQYNSLKSVNPVQFLKKKPRSLLGKFMKAKYLRLIHPKMETSFSGNLNQRKMINSGEFPETPFFAAFAEMARRIWLLHCFSFSLNQEVQIFQVKNNARFSEIHMESVTQEIFAFPAVDDGGSGSGSSFFKVAFMVIPGFKVGTTVIQSQVYVSRAASP